MRFHLITLFQEACDAYLSASIIGRARKEKKIVVKYQNPRDFVDLPAQAGNKWAYRKVDERPYGGGPGMVMTAMPIVKAVSKALHVGRRTSNMQKPLIMWLSPNGKQFTNKDADAIAKYQDVILICGRYEGIDERAKKILKTLATVKEFAVGEAVYTGGEIPALAIVDAVTRRLPGVLGKDASVEERRTASSAVYTRPETILYKAKRYKIPSVLKTGHHEKINAWRKKK
ncbi:tRNA (guanosine(37)-N1)-methyltransferase TrmD [Candidatus Kaiserbacteria bacterium]|nr:tRNA (guanosine(37)-N1)-methyltransferase TrmD [Candidatus Kaiserbacteria bacterium]